MTSPHSLEDRLRAHFADRTAHEPLPGPDTETALADVLARTADGDGDEPGPSRLRAATTDARRQPLWFAAAAALLVVAAGAAVVVAQRDEPRVSIRNGPDDDPITTVPDPTTSTSTTTSTTTTSTTTGDAGSGAGGTPLPEGMTLVVGPYGPIGGWNGDAWVQAAGWAALGATGAEEYQLVRLDQAVTDQVGTSEDVCELGEEEPTPTVDFPNGSESELTGIAVTGVADPQPRQVEVLDPSGATYRDAARDVLADLGVDEDDPNVVQAVRTDLDGDGSDEVIVVVEQITRLLGPPAGDYSIVFVRRVVDGAIATTVVDGAVIPADAQAIDRSRIDAVADLNGDGRMEIVVHYAYYEGAGQRVVALGTDGSFSKPIQGGCGA